MLTILHALKRTLSDHKPAILASVVESAGATPRSEGAHMVVSENGLLAGTIGGGAVEHQSIEKALDLLQRGESDVHHYVLNKSDAENLGMICGGDAVIRFLYLDPAKQKLLAAIDAGIEALTSGRPVQMLSGLTDKKTLFLLNIDKHLIGDAAGVALDWLERELGAKRGRRIRLEGDIVAESINRAGRVVICGGGHVGTALAHALVPLDFDVLVLDDRESFADPARYPAAVHTGLIDLRHIAADVSVTADDYVCVMTRGHMLDEEVLVQILTTDAHYIGAIGSSRKMRTIFDHLVHEHGFAKKDLLRITTPIGLDIGAETPQEIAIAIAAQLITVRLDREKAYS